MEKCPSCTLESLQFKKFYNLKQKLRFCRLLQSLSIMGR
jgi:hypothetical protein